MELVGLTGGIGSGKSTVSALLADHGFDIVDADAITRELQAPGQSILANIVDEFGEQVLLPSGELNRQRLADQVFTDTQALERLNAIVHPAVGEEISRRLTALAQLDVAVILDVPLLVESGRSDLALLVVVDIDPALAVQRLVEQRGFTPDDAWARIGRQVSRADRLSHADIVIDNNRDREHLQSQVLDLVGRLSHLRV